MLLSACHVEGLMLGEAHTSLKVGRVLGYHLMLGN